MPAIWHCEPAGSGTSSSLAVMTFLVSTRPGTFGCAESSLYDTVLKRMEGNYDDASTGRTSDIEESRTPRDFQFIVDIDPKRLKA